MHDALVVDLASKPEAIDAKRVRNADLKLDREARLRDAHAGPVRARRRLRGDRPGSADDIGRAREMDLDEPGEETDETLDEVPIGGALGTPRATAGMRRRKSS